MPLDTTPDAWRRRLEGDDPQGREAQRRAVAEAKRHSWADPAWIEPDLEGFFAAVSQPVLVPANKQGSRFIPEDHTRRPRRNSWPEVFEDAG